MTALLAAIALALCACEQESASPSEPVRAETADAGDARAPGASRDAQADRPSGPSHGEGRLRTPPPAQTVAPGCRAVGGRVVVASSRRVLGEAAVAQAGDRTGIAWTDGPIARVAVVDASGRVVGPIVDLNARGTSAQDLTIAAAGEAMFLVYKHEYGRAPEDCDLVGRRIDPSGAVGEAVVLAADVCASTYPIYRAAVRERTLFVAHTTGYLGRGVEVVRWAMGGAPVPASSPGDEAGSSVHLLAATPEGLEVAWRVELQHARWVRHRLDAAGRMVGNPERLRVLTRPRLAWGGVRTWEYRLRSGRLEIRDLPWAAANGRWRTIRIAARARRGWLEWTGGRMWAVLALATGGFRLVPLAADGTAAGAPSEIGATLLSVDGARGATVLIRDEPRELVWQALACR